LQIICPFGVVKLLIEKGANINLKDLDGWTPLIFAVNSNRIDVVPFLIDNGADLNITANTGYTALHYAVRISKVNITKLLLYEGIDVNILDNARKPAFDYAKTEEIKKLILQADVLRENKRKIIRYKQAELLKQTYAIIALSRLLTFIKPILASHIKFILSLHRH